MKIEKIGMLLFIVLTLSAIDNYANNTVSKNLLLANHIEIKQNDNPIVFIKVFFKWYKANLNSFRNAFVDITPKEPKAYRINFNKTEKYLSILKSSGFFSISYIDDLRRYFKKIDLALQKTKQYDGVVDGLDYDLVMYTQEPESYLNDLNTIQVNIVKSTPNGVIVKVKSKIDPMYRCLFALTNTKNKYLIDKISLDK